MLELNKIYNIDCLEGLKKLDDNSIDLVVTSPNYNNWRNRRTQSNREKYWKRTNIKYDICSDKQTDIEYEKEQINIINEMIRVLKPTGTICYNHKDRIFNFEVKSPLEWILKTKAIYRQRITWDRCGMQAYNPVRFYRVEEDIYLLGKNAREFKWNKECAKYLSIWRIVPNKNIYGHNATFPEEIVKRCIESFTNRNDLVVDPYNGTGTTTKMAKRFGRRFIGFEISPDYCSIANNRLKETRISKSLFKI